MYIKDKKVVQKLKAKELVQIYINSKNKNFTYYQFLRIFSGFYFSIIPSWIRIHVNPEPQPWYRYLVLQCGKHFTQVNVFLKVHG